MPKVTIPRLAIPALKITKGQLLDISIWGIGIVVPPFDIQFWPETQLLPATTVFDPDWVTTTILGTVDWIKARASETIETALPIITQAVFEAVEPYLDVLAEDFYRRHEV